MAELPRVGYIREKNTGKGHTRLMGISAKVVRVFVLGGSMGEWIRVAKMDEVEEGKGIVVEVSDKCLAVFKVEGAFHAIDNTCLHRGGPLGEGDVEGDTVICPWHGWEYNIKTGQCMNNPSSPVRAYPTIVENGEVKIEM